MSGVEVNLRRELPSCGEQIRGASYRRATARFPFKRKGAARAPSPSGYAFSDYSLVSLAATGVASALGDDEAMFFILRDDFLATPFA
ncbi:MAG: hypothetical protein QOF90_3123, partial [Acetobacteraceae bacterium]|nr:hypothetical protein [Acetobacteraceae bacterium]